MNLFLDLDGTLVDCRRRLYTLFVDLLAHDAMSCEEYWAIKSERMTQAELLKSRFGYDDKMASKFKARWMDLIESEEYLQLDTPFPFSLDFLRACRHRADVYIVTARQHPDIAERQIRNFGFAEFVKDLVVCGPGNSKSQAILACGISFNPADYFIGDTGEDVRAGKRLGVKTVAVTSGVLSEAVLREYEPDEIVENLGVARLSKILGLQAH